MKFKINNIFLMVLMVIYFLLFLYFLQKNSLSEKNDCSNSNIRKNEVDFVFANFLNNSITIINREFEFETGAVRTLFK
jgi:hypothetical protein